MAGSTSSLPSVAEYFKDKSIFLTGATGFVGKVLIEKVLRCCPEIKAVYGLIRPQKGKSAKQRLDAILHEQCFDRLRERQPDFEQKVHAIHGDVLEDNLGISAENREFLKQNINVVVHTAATVRFTEHLRLAMQMNVLAVRKLIALCKDFTSLDVFVHVSTAYSNCDKQHIEEKIYPPYVHPQKIIDMIEWMDDETISMVSPKLIRDLPNTYTFTKKLAESLLIEEAVDIPIVIVRPTIITASWKEPLPGWIDNFNGASGMYIAYGKGLMQSFKADPSTVADIIPVDFTANVILASAWYTALVYKPLKTQRPPLIYNVTSGGLNPCTWGEMEDVVASYFKEFPPSDAFRRPGKKAMTTNSAAHNYWMLVSHLIPAFVADVVYKIIGKRPRMVKTYTRLHKSMESLNFFVEQSWEWTHSTTDDLRANLSPEDRLAYYFDPREIDWTSYIESFCGGTKTFLLKEQPGSLPAARAHIRKLRNIRYVFNTMVVVILWRLLVARSSLARNSWYLVMGLIYKFVQFFKISSSIRQ